jgi:predicted permease
LSFGVIFPILVYLALGYLLICAILIGFENVELALLVVLFASPVAVSSHVMSQQMDKDEILASYYMIFYLQK